MLQVAPDRTYTLTPKATGNYEPGDKFVAGAPTITGSDFVHPNGKSKGCLTVPLAWADAIWDRMNENLAAGGTQITFITVDVPWAIPANGPGFQPTHHSWPIFNVQGAEPVPVWPTGTGPGTPVYNQY